MSVSSVGPVTYVLSNFPNYPPEAGFVFFEQIGKLTGQNAWRDAGLIKYVMSLFPTSTGWIELQFRKLAMVFHWYEISNNVNTYLVQSFSLPLRLAFIPWSVICALGLTGMIFNFLNKKSLNLLFGVLSQVAVMVVFYVLCRFRVPMVAMMAIYAGYVVQTVIQYVNPRKVWLAVGCSVAMFLFVIRPYPPIHTLFTSGDLANLFHSYYRSHFDEAAAKGDFKAGIEMEKQFLSSQPDLVKYVEHYVPLKDTNQKDLVKYYGKIYGDLGDFYRDDGQTEKAEECYREMNKLMELAQ
jgi:hypothetical protein